MLTYTGLSYFYKVPSFHDFTEKTKNFTMARSPMASCCFCIKLKAGVVIISLLWLIDGISGVVNNILVLVARNKGFSAYNYVSTFTIPLTIMYLYILVAASFGLYVLIRANVYKMLSHYTKLAIGIASVETAMRILTIIVIIMYKTDFIDDCQDTIDNTSSRVEYSADACHQGYVFSLTFAIAFGIIVALLSMYFAMVIADYARKRKNKEEMASIKEAGV